MGSLRKIVAIAFSSLAFLVIAYTALRMFSAWHQGYAWKEMDWNQDGETSIFEFLRSSDIGKRTIQKNGQTCIEYFSFKDGLPVKAICLEEISRRT